MERESRNIVLYVYINVNLKFLPDIIRPISTRMEVEYTGSRESARVDRGRDRGNSIRGCVSMSAQLYIPYGVWERTV